MKRVQRCQQCRQPLRFAHGWQCRQPLRSAHATRLRAACGRPRCGFHSAPRTQPDSSPLAGGRGAASTPLRACNPTLRRLRAARVWTIVHIGNIAMQPDLTGHKSESGRSFLIPGFCGREYGSSEIAIIARFVQEVFCRDPNEESSEMPAVPASTPLRARSAVPTATPLRSCNPTLRRLWAARVWTFVHIGNIAMQPDLTGHKSESGKSFLIPGFCGAFALPLQRYRFLKPCRQRDSHSTSHTQPDLPDQPQCGLHILKPIKSRRMPIFLKHWHFQSNLPLSQIGVLKRRFIRRHSGYSPFGYAPHTRVFLPVRHAKLLRPHLSAARAQISARIFSFPTHHAQPEASPPPPALPAKHRFRSVSPPHIRIACRRSFSV